MLASHECACARAVIKSSVPGLIPSPIIYCDAASPLFIQQSHKGDANEPLQDSALVHFDIICGTALVTGFVSKGVRVAVERVMAHFRHFVHLAQDVPFTAIGAIEISPGDDAWGGAARFGDEERGTDGAARA